MSIQIWEGDGDNISNDTPHIEYTPDPIDEYMVITHEPSDWQEVHDYIINENEIDGIPNRKIECNNSQPYSLRTSVYLMSAEEAEILKQHPKVETVELNPEKYPQPESPLTFRYKKEVGFNKSKVPNMPQGSSPAMENSTWTRHSYNGVRSNWSHLFVNNPSSEPFRGVGIATSTFTTSDMQYSLTGKNVDAVIIDSGIEQFHPEFIGEGREDDPSIIRVRDVVIDGPYKVDPTYFDNLGVTTYRSVPGQSNSGPLTIPDSNALEWWSDSTKRSSQFQSLGTVNISSSYTWGHGLSTDSNNDSNPIIDGHGTACASQVGGKSFGLAFECNLWNIRIALGGAGGVLSSTSAVNLCAIWHKAKIIAQNGDPDPTILNCSFGSFGSTGNTQGTTYTHGYRGTTLQYTGTGDYKDVPTNSGSCRNHNCFSWNLNTDTTKPNFASLTDTYCFGGDGWYLRSASSTNSAAENAIAAGCIIVSAAGNSNQKLSDEQDIDFNNWYSSSSNYINRCGGIQQGFSGTHEKTKGSIRVGALDCGVEPSDSSSPFAIRKVVYSNNGPMIDVWAPAEKTMSAGVASYYWGGYAREDDPNYRDWFFSGTSSAAPNTCSVIALYLESNRKANQDDVRNWLWRHGSVEIDLFDQYDGINDSKYWSTSTYLLCYLPHDSKNYEGNSNLRGATKRVLANPFANNTIPKISGVDIKGISFKQS